VTELTRAALDKMAEEMPAAALDTAWNEIVWLDARVDSLSKRNTSQGRHMIGLEGALTDLQAIVRQFVDDADRQRKRGISPGDKPVSWYVERFRELVAR
jgi:hypothetical protein